MIACLRGLIQHASIDTILNQWGCMLYEYPFSRCNRHRSHCIVELVKGLRVPFNLPQPRQLTLILSILDFGIVRRVLMVVSSPV